MPFNEADTRAKLIARRYYRDAAICVVIRKVARDQVAHRPKRALLTEKIDVRGEVRG